MFAFPRPRYMPCAECGASVVRDEAALHVCDSERRLDFVMLQLRGEREQFEPEWTAYLASRRGRFDVWYAARRR